MAVVPPALRTLFDAPEAERKLGAFVLVRQLGRGGFAPVWLAREVYAERELRTAAVKLFPLDGGSFDGERASQQSAAARHRDQVIDEAQSLCKVEHPNVVRFYALLVDEARGVIGLAMEYVDGAPLDRRIEEAGTLSVEQTVEVGVAVASALAAVHKKGLVHRDVKPANVVESGGVYKLIDFGIAAADAQVAPRARPQRVVLDDLPIDVVGTKMSVLGAAYTIETAEGAASTPFVATGTVGYIDPACVATGEAANAASDLYGLGALLFECLTGKLPAMASAASGTGLRGDVLDGRARAVPVSSLAPHVPDALAKIVDGLLAPERAGRPESAAMVARALAELRSPPPATSPAPAPATATAPAPATATSPATAPSRLPLVALVVALGGAAVFFGLRRGPPAPIETPPAASAAPNECALGDVAACTAACDRGSAASCNTLAVMYQTATSVPKDFARARELFKKACDLSNVGACYKLARMHEAERELTQALALFVRGCDANHAQSCHAAGTLLFEGKGAPKDAARAVGLFRRACDLEYWGGCASLGVAYDRGEGVATDLALARTLYEKACDNGAQAACANLGLMYATGRGADRDEARAAKLYAQACDGDYGWACQGLGVLYEKGAGVARDEKRAADLYDRACQKYEYGACTNLALLYAEGRGVAQSDAEAIRHFTMACDNLDAPACADLAEFYARGRHVARDPTKARALLAKACLGGLASACAGDAGSVGAIVPLAKSPAGRGAALPSAKGCTCAPGDPLCSCL